MSTKAVLILLKVEADIILYNENAGALPGDGYSGMMPSFNINEKLIACRIFTLNDGRFFSKGIWHRLLVELPYGEEFSGQIKPGISFRLNLASKVLGEGKVVRIIGQQ